MVNQTNGRNWKKKFYQKSTWVAPKASVEVESFINEIQHKFDKWKPPRWIKDNLTKVERKLLKSIQSDDQIVGRQGSQLHKDDERAIYFSWGS